MFSAMQNGYRVLAHLSIKGDSFSCPLCGERVLLKKGQIVSAHFAHVADTNCSNGQGESLEHTIAKMVLSEGFKFRGYNSEIEYRIKTLSGNRIADVVMYKKEGGLVAFELQKSNLDLNYLKERSFSYASSKIPQMWIPVLERGIWRKMERKANGDLIANDYFLSPHEIWIDGLYFGRGFWVFDSLTEYLFFARISFKSKLHENLVDLILEGPYDIRQLAVKTSLRKQHTYKGMQWPSGEIASFIKPFETAPYPKFKSNIETDEEEFISIDIEPDPHNDL